MGAIRYLVRERESAREKKGKVDIARDESSRTTFQRKNRAVIFASTTPLTHSSFFLSRLGDARRFCATRYDKRIASFATRIYPSELTTDGTSAISFPSLSCTSRDLFSIVPPSWKLVATYDVFFGNLLHCFPRDFVEKFGLRDKRLLFGRYQGGHTMVAFLL